MFSYFYSVYSVIFLGGFKIEFENSGFKVLLEQDEDGIYCKSS